MSPRLAFAIETARFAGDSTLDLFRSGRDYRLKDNFTPVTEADLGAERLIREKIKLAYPNEHVLGEEEGGDASASSKWVIDPIDGTKSFIAGVPLYSTLLAFEEDGEPVVGVAYFPALNEIVYAEKGGGCLWNDNECHVRDNDELNQAIVCCGGHKSLADKSRIEGLMKLSASCLATRTWCDAYGHMLVATGRADAMIDPIVSRWDISAMALIVREAGGSFTDFCGQDSLAEEAISCTPKLKQEILGAFTV